MTDQFGREITYLRLSVTDLCNLRCVYCMPEEGVTKLRHEDILSIEEIGEIARAAAGLGVKKIRVTGGEPLVRRGIVDICRLVSAVPGISEVCLTTNGALLPRFADKLREAGVKRVNFSLDSLDSDKYREITRGGELSDALRGIDSAREAGFEKIKINAVLMGGVNDGDIRALAELSRTKDTHVRFIELMPIGRNADSLKERYLAADAVLAAVPELEERGADGVARLYKLPGGAGTVGLISAVSMRFCQSCDRIRITSDGKLKPCLHSPEEVPLRGLRGAKLTEVMREAIRGKPLRHELDGDSCSSSARDMNAIGG